MTRIQLEGGTFHVAGSFSGRTQGHIASALAKAGANISSSIDDSLTALIAGRSCQNARNRAISRAIPILDGEDDLLTLLDHGEITISQDEAIPAAHDLSNTIAELRALCDGAPESRTWTQCLTLVEQCDPLQREEVVHYVEALIARWDHFRLPQWRPDGRHALMRGAHQSKWFEGLHPGELRVMPPLWLVEMLNGHYDVKHSLGRVVNLHHMRTNGKHLMRLLDNPHLTHMTTLCLGMMNSCSKSFFEHLVTHEHARSIEHLYVDLNATQTRTHFLQVMNTPHHTFDTLRALHVRIDPYYRRRWQSDRETFDMLPAFSRAQIDFGYWRNTGWASS